MICVRMLYTCEDDCDGGGGGVGGGSDGSVLYNFSVICHIG